VRRHDLDVFSLVTGLVFVAVAVGHILDEASQLEFDGRWVVPVVMVAIGVASLAGLVRGRDPRVADVAAWDTRPGGGDADDDADDDGEAAAAEGTDGTDGTDETLVLHRDDTDKA
jgi:hypothetical protein